MSHTGTRGHRRAFGSLASTRRFLDEAGRVPAFSWFDRLHGYVYARWVYLYIAIGVGEHPIARLLGPAIRALRAGRRIRNSSATPSPTGITGRCFLWRQPVAWCR
jgi:hypothetical protein